MTFNSAILGGSFAFSLLSPLVLSPISSSRPTPSTYFSPVKGWARKEGLLSLPDQLKELYVSLIT
jgi:hypothetical protein